MANPAISVLVLTVAPYRNVRLLRHKRQIYVCVVDVGRAMGMGGGCGGGNLSRLIRGTYPRVFLEGIDYCVPHGGRGAIFMLKSSLLTFLSMVEQTSRPWRRQARTVRMLVRKTVK